MKILKFLLIIPIILTGCVGVVVPYGKIESDSLHGDYYYVSIEDGKRHAWTSEQLKQNGRVLVAKKQQWCGPIIAVGVLIPIMLPVCQYRQYAEFSDGISKSVKIEGVGMKGILCGPGIIIATSVMGGNPKTTFCTTEISD